MTASVTRGDGGVFRIKLCETPSLFLNTPPFPVRVAHVPHNFTHR